MWSRLVRRFGRSAMPTTLSAALLLLAARHVASTGDADVADFWIAEEAGTIHFGVNKQASIGLRDDVLSFVAPGGTTVNGAELGFDPRPTAPPSSGPLGHQTSGLVVRALPNFPRLPPTQTSHDRALSLQVRHAHPRSRSMSSQA